LISIERQQLNYFFFGVDFGVTAFTSFLLGVALGVAIFFLGDSPVFFSFGVALGVSALGASTFTGVALGVSVLVSFFFGVSVDFFSLGV